MMAHYAYLEVELHCAQCAALLTDFFSFQWGYCAARLAQPESTYYLGEQIRWKQCDHAGVYSWVYFQNADGPAGANIGDPDIRDLIVHEGQQFHWDEYFPRRQCPACGEPIEGAAMQISDGKIVRVWVYQQGELDPHVDLHLVQADGSLILMPMWQDHSMAFITECHNSSIGTVPGRHTA